MITVVLVVAGLAAVGYVLISRLRGQQLNARRVLVLPLVLTGIGLLQVVGIAQHGLGALDVVLLVAGLGAAALLGAARGATVTMSEHDGRPWLRYRPVTLAWWLATIVARAGPTALAFSAGAVVAASGPALLLGVGVTLLAEGVTIVRRAFPAGGPDWQAALARRQATPR